MPKFDKRFARQYCCEPPPEFPLASPYSGRVHQLSGPNSHALNVIPSRFSASHWYSGQRASPRPPDQDQSMVPSFDYRYTRHNSFSHHIKVLFTFITHFGFVVLHNQNTRMHVGLLGPCFKTGRWRPFAVFFICAMHL